MTISPDTPLIITSDVHIGSPYCRTEAFLTFLAQLPADAALVLNGDTLDRPAMSFSEDHDRVLQALADLARRRRVIVVEGNHDGLAALECMPGAEGAEELVLPGRLVALHGHQIDSVMPAHRHFIRLFRRFHALRVLLGAPDIHVAEYAKRWRLAYRVLVRRQRRNAIQYARNHRVPALICGHVHAPEDVSHHGVRYLNTGSWTEKPSYCVNVRPDRVDFVAGAELTVDAT